MKKFVNEKFLSALFNTYCRNVDTMTANYFLETAETFSSKDYENSKLKAMLESQKIENNILIRRNLKSENAISKLYYF